MLRRILVVDDNTDAADALATVLALSGNEVETAHDAVAAIAVAERFLPDVVLLDLGMPGVDGLEAARRIRARPWGKDLLLVAQTGRSQSEDRRRTKEAGFDAHFVKPVDFVALLDLLARIAMRPPSTDTVRP